MSADVRNRESVERLVPSEMAGKLIEAEHRGRYWWAAQLAAGKTVLDAGCGLGYGTATLSAAGAAHVTGVDVAQDAVDRARAAAQDGAVDFVVADIHALPFEGASFDMVTCFEVIEHVERQDEAVAELRRVLRPGGVLAISSPNRREYPPGNEHHVHEFVPEELREALAQQFAHVTLYRQLPWLVSALLGDEELAALRAGDVPEIPLRMARAIDAEEMFTVALASDDPLPVAPPLVTTCSELELRWWHEQLNASAARAMRAERAESAARVLTRESADEILATERQLAHALSHNQALSEQLAYCEAERDHAMAMARRSDGVVEDMKASVSWRLTSPLRAFKRLARD